MFVLFFLIRDGERMFERLRYLLPLTTDQENRIFRQLDDVAKSVILGAFIIALAQGVAGGLGLFIVGIQPFFWGCMVPFCFRPGAQDCWLRLPLPWAGGAAPLRHLVGFPGFFAKP